MKGNETVNRLPPSLSLSFFFLFLIDSIDTVCARPCVRVEYRTKEKERDAEERRDEEDGKEKKKRYVFLLFFSPYKWHTYHTHISSLSPLSLLSVYLPLTTAFSFTSHKKA